MKNHPRKQNALRQHLKKANEDHWDLDDQYFAKLHDRIMAQVDQTEMDAPIIPASGWRAIPAKLGKQLPSKSRLREILFSHESFFTVIIISVLSFQFWSESVYDHWMHYQTKDDKLILLAMNAPDEAQSLAGIRSGPDFFVDLSDQSMNDLIYEELQSERAKPVK